MIAVTYHTNRKYKAMSQRLKESCDALGLHCAIYQEKDTGTWEGNVYRKPHVVRKALIAYPNEDVLFVDADAMFRRYPLELVGSQWEVACYFESSGYPVSGTVFVSNTERARLFVDAWCEGCDRGEGKNEDFHWMAKALRSVPYLKVGYLPPAYFWKEKEMRGRFPTALPVVEHYTVGEHTFK